MPSSHAAGMLEDQLTIVAQSVRLNRYRAEPRSSTSGQLGVPFVSGRAL
jgi:hypothetical protein